MSFQLPDNVAKIVEAPRGAPKVEAGMYGFLSFDLVNSTDYKTRRNDWLTVTSAFYTSIERETTADQSICRWKRLGDEVLFYARLDSPRVVPALLHHAWASLRKTLAYLGSKHAQAFQTRADLSLKATAWVGWVRPWDIAQALTSADGSNFAIEDGLGIDFIGPDIDAGFRIAKHAHRGLLTISAELAGLALQADPATHQRMRVAGYDLLKGVWRGRHVPVVWYHGDWPSYLSQLAYDDELLQPMLKVCGSQGSRVSDDGIRRILTETGQWMKLEPWLVLG